MNLDTLLPNLGEWLRGTGPESDVVVSTRIRQARNHADYPVSKRATNPQKGEIVTKTKEAIAKADIPFKLDYQDVPSMPALDRQFLVERQLISRELSEASGARSVFIDAAETYSLMVNEEDHLRMQVMHSGLDLDAAWQQISQMDDWLDQRVSYAYHERLGYLTACPTNVGTGMRVSVMLHLPALVITQQIEKVFRSLQKMGLAVRGLYGEGSQAMGDFYQISNQVTLGRSEADLVKQVAEVIPVIIDYEHQARAFLVKESRNDLKDRVSRAYGILCTAQTISSEETLHLLSSVRMGVYLGLIKDLEIPTINKLFIHTQPAHLQKLRGMNLDTAERNVERAHYLQDHLRRQNGGGPLN